MKHLLPLFLILLGLHATGYPQATEKFDIATFVVPKGWQKEVKADAAQFGTEDANGGVCLVTLFKSIPGSEDPRANFDASWETIVKEVVPASGKPQMSEPASENGWTAQSGAAAYESDGKKGVVMLVTLTGDRKIVNILILTNSLSFQPQIDQFVGSIVLPKVEVQKPPVSTGPAPADQTTSRLIGKWNRSSSSSPSYADPASWGSAGYTKSRYEFRADGSYVYTERSFSYSYQNIIVVKESGKYQVAGNQITIRPQKSVVEAYSKRNGTDTLGSLVKSQNRQLEVVTYQFTFHFFSGIKEWNFVLQASKPTNRDGAFSSLTVFPNAWYFDQKFIDNDLTSPTGR